MMPMTRSGLPLPCIEGGQGEECVCVEGFSEQVPASAPMGGTETVVIHTALFTVMVAVVLGALVDTITGTDVVISVQTGGGRCYQNHFRHRHIQLRVSV